MNSVKNFGAAGDGVADDTSAIQAAIDHCNSEGGGTVILDPGIYATGSLYLYDNINLHLEASATIKADPNAAWNRADCFKENEACVDSREKVDGRHLIIAYKAKNVSIIGKGTIDGNHLAFYGDVGDNGRRQIIISRPAQMVFFCDCQNVSIRDIRMVNACFWTLFIYGCSNVTINGVYARTAPDLWCCDGIDIDASQDVFINNCTVESEDDCMTIRCNDKFLEGSRRCENVIVSNCMLNGANANGIRVGVGDGQIKNIIFSNIKLKATRGIMVCGRYLESQQGTSAENLVFSDFSIEATEPFFVSCGFNSRQKCSNIIFDSMKVKAKSCSYIGGMPDNLTSNVSFNNIEITQVEGYENDVSKTDLIQGIWAVVTDGVYYQTPRGAPFALWLENVKNCSFHNCSITLNDKNDKWLAAIKTENNLDSNIQGLAINGFGQLVNEYHSRAMP